MVSYNGMTSAIHPCIHIQKKELLLWHHILSISC